MPHVNWDFSVAWEHPEPLLPVCSSDTASDSHRNSKNQTWIHWMQVHCINLHAAAASLLMLFIKI